MKVTILASGSGGNVSLFESGGTRVMVDAGLGARALARGFVATDAAGPPHAIVVTHAHGDHVGHCEALSRRWRIPVYMTEATARIARHRAGDRLRVFGAREPFTIGGLTVTPVPLPHDAAQVALRFGDGVHSAAIATDLGEVPPSLPELVGGCDVLLIESNHDAAMLARGPYPEHLKRRIASARGHLSNAQTHALLRALPADRGAHTVVLMHLSERNNAPDLALEVARDALVGRRVRVLAAAQDDALVIDTTQPFAYEPIAPTPTPARDAGATHRPPRVQLALPF